MFDLIANLIRLVIALLAVPIALAIDLFFAIWSFLNGEDVFQCTSLAAEAVGLAFSRIVDPEGDLDA